MTQRVNVLIPCYRAIDPDCMFSILGLVLHARELLYDVKQRNYLYIDQARNHLVRETLEGGAATHALWLDSDMVFPADTVQRLLAHDVPVVGGTYFRRNPPFNHVAMDWTEGGARPLDRLHQGLRPAGILGTGCLLVRTDVFGKMRDHFGDERWFRSEETGEDVWFFDRLHKMSIQPFLDGDLIAGHVSQHIITDAHWRATHAADPDAPGGTPPDFLDLYEQAVKEIPDGGTAVEVGCYLGRSIIHLAEMVRRSGKHIRIVAVDHFKGSNDPPESGDSTERHRAAAARGGGSFRDEMERNLAEYGVRNLVEIIEGNSAEAAAVFADDSVDFCFIDAAHDEASVHRDIAAWRPKIKAAGVLAGHDYNWESVRQAVNTLLPAAMPRSRSCWWWRKPA